DLDFYLRTKVQAIAVLGKLFPHDDLRNDRIYLDTRNVLAAGGKRARYVPTAAWANYQRFRSRAQHVGKSRARVPQLESLLLREVLKIEVRDTGGCVRINDDTLHRTPARLLFQGNSRKLVPANKFFATDSLPFGVVHIDQRGFPVISNKTNE